MKEYPNFYENLKEASTRLQGTIVCYDGIPYYVYRICDGRPDNIFRIYLVGLNSQEDYPNLQWPDIETYVYQQQAASAVVNIGDFLDKWMVKNPTFPMIRKMINSPLFRKFRPFPLGMCNYGKFAFYLERQPLRKSEQGLISSAIDETPLGFDISPVKMPRGAINVNLKSKAFQACVVGEHPTPQAVLDVILDPQFENRSVAFHRNFALVRGPIGMTFLAYKADLIGLLPNNDFNSLRVGKDFGHTREVIEALGLFTNIEIQK